MSSNPDPNKQAQEVFFSRKLKKFVIPLYVSTTLKVNKVFQLNLSWNFPKENKMFSSETLKSSENLYRTYQLLSSLFYDYKTKN